MSFLAHARACKCASCLFEETRAAYEEWTVKTAAEMVKAATPPTPAPGSMLATVTALLDPRSGPMISPDEALRLLDLSSAPAAPKTPALTKRSSEPLHDIEAWLPPRSPAPRKRPRMLLVDRLGFERIEEWHGGHSHIVASHGGINGQHIEVRFDWYGRTDRNGEELVEFREVSEHMRPQWRLEPEFPSVEALARAIFNTDREVRSFITDVADNVVPLTETRWSTALGRSETVAIRGQDVAEIRKWDPKLLQRAWDHDEHGWRTRAMLRAKNVIASLKGTLP